MQSSPERLEEEHVHAVYEKIATHFSNTRHSPWPIVRDFLLEQRPGSVGLDIGCGNGKYLGVNENICIFGSDKSTNLVKIARERQYEVCFADGLALPHPSNRFVCLLFDIYD